MDNTENNNLVKQEPEVEYELVLPPINENDRKNQEKLEKLLKLVRKCTVEIVELDFNLRANQKGPEIFKTFFVCRQCNKICITKALVHHHEKRECHHLHRSRSYICPKCGLKCSSQRQYDRHVSSQQSYKCRACALSCRRILWMNHVRDHEDLFKPSFKSERDKKDYELLQMKKKYRCTTCTERFRSKPELRFHQKFLKHGIFNESFGCSRCKKAFCESNHLKYHQRDCRQKEPLEEVQVKTEHQCGHCDNSFFHAESLASHMEAKHRKDQPEDQPEDQSDYQPEDEPEDQPDDFIDLTRKVQCSESEEDTEAQRCRKCSARFFHKKYLWSHMRSVHKFYHRATEEKSRRPQKKRRRNQNIL